MRHQGDLFERGMENAITHADVKPPRVGPRRLRPTLRNQIELRECSLDDLLSEDHQARIV